jgi:hypothetical protein
MVRDSWEESARRPAVGDRGTRQPTIPGVLGWIGTRCPAGPGAPPGRGLHSFRARVILQWADPEY